MSAYFKAVEELKPNIHSYEYPDGNYQLAMAIIADTMMENKESPYYTEGVLDSLTINIDELASLQSSYEMLKKYMVADDRECFFGILCSMTGFCFDDEEETTSKQRVQVAGDDIWIAEQALDIAGIEWECDEGGRLIISADDVEEAISVLEEEGFKASVV